MKTAQNVIVVIVLLFSISLIAKQVDYGNVYCYYVSNYDGDTITVNIPSYPPIVGEKITVRINGIDCPELRTKSDKEKELARTAKKLVNSLLENAKVIELRNMQRDKYFRILADVYFDDKNLTEILLKNKLAVEYDGGTKTKDWSN